MPLNTDPEQPEPELTRAERKSERNRFRLVRRERRKLSRKRTKDKKARSKGKEGKKNK